MFIYISVYLKYLFPRSMFVDFLNKEILFPISSYISYFSFGINVYDLFFNIIRGDKRRYLNRDYRVEHHAITKYPRLNLDFYWSRSKSSLYRKFLRWVRSTNMNFNILKYVISKNVYDHIDPLRSFKYEMPLYFSSGLIWNDFMNVRKKSV